MFGLDRAFSRIVLLPPLLLAGGCASFSDRPTSEKVDSLLRTERKVVTVTLAESQEAITQRVIERAAQCVASTLKTSGDMPPGGGALVPVSSTMHQQLEQGRTADGRHWLALRMDGLIHAVAFGLQLHSLAAGEVEIKAFPADSRQPDRIKELVASGEIFCKWREVSYPYD